MGYTSLSIALIAVSVVFPLIATLCVALRLQARLKPKWRLMAADYVVAVALVVAVGNSITNIAGVVMGGIGNGEGMMDLSLDQITSQTQVLFAFQFFLLFSIALVKISIIIFYKQIFAVPRFKLAANLLIAIIIAWLIAFFLTTLFQTWPISMNWIGVGINLLNEGAMYTAQAVLDIVLDLAVLCMPLPMIKNLNLSTQRKWNLVGIFWLGAFCVVASIVRLYYNVLYNSLNNNGSNDQNAFSSVVVNILIWSTIEPCVSIIAACLPTYGPLFRHGGTFKSLVSSIRSLMRTSKTSTHHGSISLADGPGGHMQASREPKAIVYRQRERTGSDIALKESETALRGSENDLEAQPRHLL